MLQREVEIINKLGLHARASAKLTQVAGQYKSSIWLIRGIRALIAAAASIAFAFGIVYGSRATILIAAVILGEELYETGVLLLLLRRRP